MNSDDDQTLSSELPTAESLKVAAAETPQSGKTRFTAPTVFRAASSLTKRSTAILDPEEATASDKSSPSSAAPVKVLAVERLKSFTTSPERPPKTPSLRDLRALTRRGEVKGEGGASTSATAEPAHQPEVHLSGAVEPSGAKSSAPGVKSSASNPLAELPREEGDASSQQISTLREQSPAHTLDDSNLSFANPNFELSNIDSLFKKPSSAGPTHRSTDIYQVDPDTSSDEETSRPVYRPTPRTLSPVKLKFLTPEALKDVGSELSKRGEAARVEPAKSISSPETFALPTASGTPRFSRPPPPSNASPFTGSFANRAPTPRSIRPKAVSFSSYKPPQQSTLIRALAANMSVPGVDIDWVPPVSVPGSGKKFLVLTPPDADGTWNSQKNQNGIVPPQPYVEVVGGDEEVKAARIAIETQCSTIDANNDLGRKLKVWLDTEPKTEREYQLMERTLRTLAVAQADLSTADASIFNVLDPQSLTAYRSFMSKRDKYAVVRKSAEDVLKQRNIQQNKSAIAASNANATALGAAANQTVNLSNLANLSLFAPPASSTAATYGQPTPVYQSNLPKLPALPLPQFSGRGKDYASWKVRFDSMIGNSNSDVFTKYQYLLNGIKGCKRAMDIAAMHDFTARGYTALWRDLDEEYAGVEKQIKAWEEDLHALPRIRVRNLEDLKDYIIKARVALGALKDLGLHASDNQRSWMNTMVAKLDESYFSEWLVYKRTIPEDQKQRNLIHHFLIWLDLLAKETAEIKETKSHEESMLSHRLKRANTEVKKDRDRRRPQNTADYVDNFHTAAVTTRGQTGQTQAPRPIPPLGGAEAPKRGRGRPRKTDSKDPPGRCLFCGGNHPPRSCRADKSNAVDTAWPQVWALKLCRCCLMQGHAPRACEFVNKKCGIRNSEGGECEYAHHRNLHGATYTPPPRESQRGGRTQ